MNNISRIEIGSGKWPHIGYTHIDIEKNPNVDIVGDFRTMSFSELEEIRSHHLLEHFSRNESIEVLKLWHSWLKKDGVLTIETPDFEYICAKFSSDKKWMTQHTFGSQEANWAYHKDGWWEEKFRKILPEIGFEIVIVKRSTSKVIRDEGEDKGRHILPNITITAKKI